MNASAEARRLDSVNSAPRPEGGFSLLEALVVAALLIVVTGGTLKILYQGQETFQSQTALNRTSEQARIAMDVMVRYLRHAGNDPFDFMESNGIPAVRIVSSSEMVINSDVTGAVASATANPKEATGDPDGALNSIHEQVRFRHDAGTERLFMDIGYGETELAQRVVALDLEYRDANGQPTGDSNAVAQVNIKMIVRTEQSGMRSARDLMTLHSEVFLRSKTFSPFEAALE